MALQCIGATNCTHIKIKEPNKQYSDYISRSGYYTINVQVFCDYRYCFLDVVVKWPGSVHDSTIFLNSSINRKLRNRECEKVLVEGRDVITIYLIRDTAYPLFPFIMKEYPGRGEKQREKYFNYK